jgi:anti-sigma B factor antagonist
MLKTENINGVLVVSFKNVNRFNALVSEAVKEELKSYFNSPDTKLVLSLEGISFIDSSGFGVFLSIMKTANNNYGYFKISDINEEAMELFKLLQLHNVFEIYNTKEDALKSFE